MVLPTTGGSAFARQIGLTVPFTDIKTNSVVRCRQPRVLNRDARNGRKVDTLWSGFAVDLGRSAGLVRQAARVSSVRRWNPLHGSTRRICITCRGWWCDTPVPSAAGTDRHRLEERPSTPAVGRVASSKGCEKDSSSGRIGASSAMAIRMVRAGGTFATHSGKPREARRCLPMEAETGIKTSSPMTWITACWRSRSVPDHGTSMRRSVSRSCRPHDPRLPSRATGVP